MSTTNATVDAQRWLAVLERRVPEQDGFVYAVITTGIYCRPSCVSRRPKRENVRFFDSGKAAQQAGFRACKRCRPDAKGKNMHAATVQRACRTIERAELEPSLAELAAEAGMSPHHFQRVFKSHLGLSPKGFAKALRAKRFKTALKGNTQVTGALYEAGFSGPSRAYESSKENMGMSPTSWRDGAKGETIHYAVADCYLGRVIVAGTARGICAIEFGDQDKSLVAGLRTRFPNAALAPADDSFTGWLRTVLTFVESPQQGLDLPLDIRGTAFQERVWRALRQIAAGTTVSYAELAKKIGQPTATRAVAGACAANKIAVAIPCHRVVRGDGTISGYRWGPKRKRMILDRESPAEGPDT